MLNTGDASDDFNDEDFNDKDDEKNGSAMMIIKNVVERVNNRANRWSTTYYDDDLDVDKCDDYDGSENFYDSTDHQKNYS